MEPRYSPTVSFEVCPIRSSLGILGRRWALLILRDISFLRRVRFSDMLRNNPGLHPRLLSIRLRELRREGLIERAVNPHDHREIWYELTGKGRDVVPILTALIQYGAKHRAKEVFRDKKSETIERLFPKDRDYMLGQLYGYARGPRTPGKSSE